MHFQTSQMTVDTNLQADLAQTDESVNTTATKTSAPVVEPVTVVKPVTVVDRVKKAFNNPIKKSEKKTIEKLDFSVDYNIPTLDEIALPGDEQPATKIKKPTIPIPKHILASESNTEKNNDITLSPELIDKLGQDLVVALMPEIEKSIRYALNSTLASVMDQSARATKDIVRKRIEELLPKLIKEHLKNSD